VSGFECDPEKVRAACEAVEQLEWCSSGVAGAVLSGDGSLDNLCQRVVAGAPQEMGDVVTALTRFFSVRAGFKDTHTRVFAVTEGARALADAIQACDEQGAADVALLQQDVLGYTAQGDFSGFTMPQRGW